MYTVLHTMVFSINTFIIHFITFQFQKNIYKQLEKMHQINTFIKSKGREGQGLSISGRVR